MVAAYLTDQKDLLDAAFKFAWDNKGKLVETESWSEMVSHYPDLIGKAFSQSMLQTKYESVHCSGVLGVKNFDQCQLDA